MATLTWPNTVPDKPRPEDYEEVDGSTTIKSAVEVGPAKKRRRTTAEVDRLRLAIDMTDSEVTDFIDFYDNTTKQGALRFDFTHPRKGTTVEARFDSQPTRRPVDVGGKNWIVRFELEVLP